MGGSGNGAATLGRGNLRRSKPASRRRRVRSCSAAYREPGSASRGQILVQRRGGRTTSAAVCPCPCASTRPNQSLEGSLQQGDNLLTRFESRPTPRSRSGTAAYALRLPARHHLSRLSGVCRVCRATPQSASPRLTRKSICLHGRILFDAANDVNPYAMSASCGPGGLRVESRRFPSQTPCTSAVLSDELYAVVARREIRAVGFFGPAYVLNHGTPVADLVLRRFRMTRVLKLSPSDLASALL
jgi:hypothetical protein